MRKYAKRFFSEEDGMETIEFVVVLAVIAGLIGIVAAVATRISTTGSSAEDKVNTNLDKIDTFLEKAEE